MEIFELPLFSILGVLGGLYSAVFIKLNLKMRNFRSREPSDFPVTEVFLVTLITSVIGVNFDFLRPSNMSLMNVLFKECLPEQTTGVCIPGFKGQVYVALMLLFTAVVKGGLTIITFGLGVPAGIFIPSMVVGACVGRAFGIATSLVQFSFPDLWIFSSCIKDQICIHPNTYASNLI
jgi:chloride channel 3/4/5